MLRARISLLRALVFFGLGLLTGTQGALYLYDTFDDGVSDPRSGVIALLFLLVSLTFILWSFRRRRS